MPVSWQHQSDMVRLPELEKPESPSVQIADWWRDADAIRQVRTAVFVVEQGIPAALEWDGMDVDCDHVLVRDRDGSSLATGRLMADGRIGRMAVLAAWRNRGIGRQLLAELLELAGQRGLREVYLHAQLEVVPFYRMAGFRAHGEPFAEAGIRHILMQRELS
jgi:predicted GNAT family N-acyltransferase